MKRGKEIWKFREDDGLKRLEGSFLRHELSYYLIKFSYDIFNKRKTYSSI